MRRTLALAALAASLLSGCSSTGVAGITPAVLTNAIVAACGITVDALTVANLIAAGNQTLTSAQVIATQVCDAWKAASAPVASTRFGVVLRQVGPITVYIGGVPVNVTGAKPL